MSTSLMTYKQVLVPKPNKKINRADSIQIPNKPPKPVTLPKLKTEGQEEVKSPVKKERPLISHLNKQFEIIKAQHYIVM